MDDENWCGMCNEEELNGELNGELKGELKGGSSTTIPHLRFAVPNDVVDPLLKLFNVESLQFYFPAFQVTAASVPGYIRISHGARFVHISLLEAALAFIPNAQAYRVENGLEGLHYCQIQFTHHWPDLVHTVKSYLENI